LGGRGNAFVENKKAQQRLRRLGLQKNETD